jgi:hypothetical protein
VSPPLRIGVLLAAALALGGCGPLERAELKRGVESLSALAAEGRVLADGAARDRTKRNFTRVHARVLAEDAQHEAEKLADAHPAAGLEAERDQAVAIAQRIADILGELQVTPGAERTAKDAQRQLGSTLGEADRLAQGLGGER